MRLEPLTIAPEILVVLAIIPCLWFGAVWLVAERIVRETPCSVLAFKPDDFKYDID